MRKERGLRVPRSFASRCSPYAFCVSSSRVTLTTLRCCRLFGRSVRDASCHLTHALIMQSAPRAMQSAPRKERLRVTRYATALRKGLRMRPQLSE